ncbi:MAG: type II toxin-antitoxin system HicB family antitoxin [Geminicoccaceae bacterium]
MSKAEGHAYPARFVVDDDGRVVVSFRDVPEALTDGADHEEATFQAADALAAALEGYLDPERNPRPLPTPSLRRSGEVMIKSRYLGEGHG